MSLRNYLRSYVNNELKGLELGPSYNPIFAKRDGWQVQVVDHLPAEQLRAKYRNESNEDVPEDVKAKYAYNTVDTEVIEDVDIIWNGGRLSDRIAPEDRETYNYIAASHFIEHVPDVIGFLSSCEEVLEEDGVILLLIPDLRFCFDANQPHTDVAVLLDRHRRLSASHDFSSFYRHITNYVTADTENAWGQDSRQQFSISGATERSVVAANDCANAREYIDTHGSYFTPLSFASIIYELQYLGLINLELHSLTKSEGCEFAAVLAKRTSTYLSRDEYLTRKHACFVGMLQEKHEQFRHVEQSETFVSAIAKLAEMQKEFRQRGSNKE